MKRLSILLLLSASMLWLNAASADVVADSIPGNERTAYADSLSILNWAPGWAKEYLNSLMRGNVDRTHERKLDLSFAVTPSYTREAGFGIGGAATGLYRVNRLDSVMPPSDVFLSINASLNGFYVLTLKGNNLFPTSGHASPISLSCIARHSTFGE